MINFTTCTALKAEQMAGVPNPWVIVLKTVKGLCTDSSNIGVGVVLPIGDLSSANKFCTSLTTCL